MPIFLSERDFSFQCGYEEIYWEKVQDKATKKNIIIIRKFQLVSFSRLEQRGN